MDGWQAFLNRGAIQALSREEKSMEILLKPIGVIHSPFTEKTGIPFQPFHSDVAGWVEVDTVARSLDTFPELGQGEGSTLALALERPEGCLVLMDEPMGRARAREQDIPVAGVAGLLLAARRAGLVERIAPFLEKLQRSDFRISAEIVRATLREAGE